MLTRELNLNSPSSLIGAGTKMAGDFFFFSVGLATNLLFKLCSSVFGDSETLHLCCSSSDLLSSSMSWNLEFCFV